MSGVHPGVETAGQISTTPYQSVNSFPQDSNGQQRTPDLAQNPHVRGLQRSVNASPIQTSDISTASSRDVYNVNRSSPKSPTIMRVTSDAQSSPQSSQFRPNSNNDKPRSPRDRDKEGTSGSTFANGKASDDSDESVRRITTSPAKAHCYSQLRNVSSPLPQAPSLGNSSPPSPRTIVPPQAGLSPQPEARPMPRTSSIDSAISNVSLSTMHSYRPSQDSTSSSLPDISNLIQTAGSPEMVIQHLLKEKQHLQAQNTQLWGLFNKQRTLLLGLNQDLEKALKDKERYRKKLKDYQESVPPVPSTMNKASTAQSIPLSRSPTPSEATVNTQNQAQKLERENGPDRDELVVSATAPLRDTDGKATSSSNSIDRELTNTEDGWVRSKARPSKDSKHSHKTTSSSDIGVFGPSKPSVAPIQTNVQDSKNAKNPIDSPSHLSPSSGPVGSPSTSFTAKRSQPFSAKGFNGPALALTESTPPLNDLERMTPPRKAPPAPLDLGQPKQESSNQHEFGPEDHSESDYDEDVEVDELPAFERGRKKTREDDDKEREVALLKESQDRSRSTKVKSSKSRKGSGKSVSQDKDKAASQQTVPFTPTFKSISPESLPAGGSAFLAPPTSLASVLSPPEARNGIREQFVSTQPMSPGLPLSPRPNHRPVNPPTPRLPRDGPAPSFASPPLSPKPGFIGLPLSPRSPRQPIPLPPQTPMSLTSPKSTNTEPRNESDKSFEEPSSPTKSLPTSPKVQSEGSPTTSSHSSQPKSVFRGLVSEAYPDLLLPPNAIPSILVHVVSSRLRPSRQSLIVKGCDEEPVFTLGISARSDRQGLWQVEKPIQSLQLLDQQLRQNSDIAVKQPDRSLFSGHAPAKVDARRIALEKYFEVILDTELSEKSALTLCRYLSTNVSEPSGEDSYGTSTAPDLGSSTSQSPIGRLPKEGYLTKRGKNFGGWKVRYFVLDDPILRYYDAPGGSLLGTIKLQGAQIGKQSNQASYSPSRGDEEEGLYRHAFLIREPKRRDANSYIDHVLCAESDTERDSWVNALLRYVGGQGTDGDTRPTMQTNNSGSLRTKVPSKKNSLKKDGLYADSPDSEVFDSLQAVPYENTQAAQAPVVQVVPDLRPNDSPSPTTSGSQPSIRAPSAQSKTISGPQNGAKIDDVGAWGNKPMAPPLALPKEQKKRSIWGFRDKNAGDLGANHSNDSNLSLTQQQYQEQITNVKAAFGAPLAEAVEYCRPRGVEVYLPAVVYRCLEYLEAKNGADEEGIFRMSGSNTLIKNLKTRFNAEGDIDLLGSDEPYYDVHAVASLLKGYLRELPQPILTRDFHIHFLKALGK